MCHFLFNKHKFNTGFTLMEIMIVIVIIGVSASFALPRFTSTFERVRASEGVQLLTALLAAQKTFQFENGGAYAGDPALLDVQITDAQFFNTPPGAANPLDPVADPIATITRINSYTLEINEEGTITCTDGGGTPDFTCAQAGY